MDTISFKRHRFPPEIIRRAVWLYARFTLSYRDVEDLLAERGVNISYESVRNPCGPLRLNTINVTMPSGLRLQRLE